MTEPRDIIGIVTEMIENESDSVPQALRIAVKALEDVEKMRAEDNFKSWKNKVNDVQTWQEEFINTVVLKPVNEHAAEALSRIRSL